MDKSHPSQNGLTRPHVHYSFLKTAAEGLSLTEEGFCLSAQDSLESDCESLVQEKQYQLELQQRIHNSEELLSQSYYELEEDSLEEDNLEEKPSSKLEESDAEEAPFPTGSNWNSNHTSSREEITELRHSPNWKYEGEGIAKLKKSHPEDAPCSPFSSRCLTCSPPQERLVDRNHDLKEGQQDDRSVSVSLSFCSQPASVSNGSYQSPKNREPEGEAGTACQYSSNSSICSYGSSAQTKDSRQQRSKKDFVRKNKHTLGFAAQQDNSYLQRYSKKQREESPGQVHQCQGPEMRGTNSNQGPALKESSIQHPMGAAAEPQGQHSEHHNELECENAPTNSSSYRELASQEQDRRSVLYPPVAVLWPSITPGNQDIPLHTSAVYFVHPDGKEVSMNLTFAQNPLQPSSYSRLFHLPSTGGNSKKYQQNLVNASGYQQHFPCRCAVSEPHGLAGHGVHQKHLGYKNCSSAYDSGLQRPVNVKLLDRNSRNIYSEGIGSNVLSGGPGPAQPHTHHVIRAPSPTECLIQSAEKHLRDICQLADDHLAGMFHLPPLIQRGESDSQLNLESNKESQTVLSRSNSEGYLLQMENEKHGKRSRKGSRIKGYMKMDVKLGGLGADHETIKEKAEKIKQQKAYAKQIKEHNRKNLISGRKPSAVLENKFVASRQKALEYAKTITKPKLVRSKPPEPEPKDEKNLAPTLNGENLPPISSLESLQNRHEREKQVVAAFKTLHIV